MRRLHTLCLPDVLVVILWTTGAGADTQSHSSSHFSTGHPPTATTLVMPGITVDGDLSDWPPGMERHAITNDFGVYGPTDIDGVDLSRSTDLNPSFRVGYNPDEDLLYLAVEVRDDELVLSNDYAQGDACEVYVVGTGISLSPSTSLSPLMYVMVPGEGIIRTNYGKNPGLHGHDIGRTRTTGAYSRRGNLTTYEWAIDVFDRYPSIRTPLEHGGSIGFDVVVVDKDYDEGNAAWVPWGPPQPSKFSNGASRIGRLSLSATSVLTPEQLALAATSRGFEAARRAIAIFAGDDSKLVAELATAQETLQVHIGRMHESQAMRTEVQAMLAEQQAMSAEVRSLAAQRAARAAAEAGALAAESGAMAAAQAGLLAAEAVSEALSDPRIYVHGDGWGRPDDGWPQAYLQDPLFP